MHGVKLGRARVTRSARPACLRSSSRCRRAFAPRCGAPPAPRPPRAPRRVARAYALASASTGLAAAASGSGSRPRKRMATTLQADHDRMPAK